MNQDAMADVLTKLRPGVTVHGFRSTFRDWAAETTRYPNYVVEMALAHAIPSGGGSGLSARRPYREEAGADGRLGAPLPCRAGRRRDLGSLREVVP